MKSGTNFTYRLFLSYAIPVIVMLATSVIVIHQAKALALSDEDNTNAFYSFADGLEQYKDERQEWRTRILSNFLAGRLVNIVEGVYGATDRQAVIPRVAAIWSFAWLLMINAVLVVIHRERALLFILATFTAMTFAYTPGIGAARVYPWDLPALFFFTCFVAVLKLRREEWLVVLIPLATLFKETALLLVVAFFFWQVPWRRRLLAMVTTAVSALFLKGVVDVVTGNPSPIFTMTLRDGPEIHRYITNLHHLVAVGNWTRHPVFINAGLLMSLLLMPMGDRRIRMVQIIAMLFILGNFLFGNIVEYRIWFELVPLSLYAIEIYFSHPALATEPRRPGCYREP
jgi:hypothetical protein